MYDKVSPGYPRPLAPQPAVATKGQRPWPPTYQPESPTDAARRSCCCRCLLWFAVAVLVIAVLLGLAVGIFFAIFRPGAPTFSLESLRLSTFNLTGDDELFVRLDASVSAHNPSSNGLAYVYFQPINISAHTAGIVLASGSFPAFVHSSGETKSLKASLRRDGEVLDAVAARRVRKMNRVLMSVKLDGEARIKVRALRTVQARVHVDCGNFGVPLPKVRSPVPGAVTPERTCRVDVKVKLWKWNV